MTKQQFKDGVNLPGWAIAAIITIFMALTTYSVATGSRITRNEEKVCTVEKQIEVKANQSEVDRIYKQLDRIETKLDKLPMPTK